MKNILTCAGLAICLAGVVCAVPQTSNGYGGRSSSGLHVGNGGYSPMEARLERMSGNSEASSSRVGNAQAASRRMKKSVSAVSDLPAGRKVRLVEVRKGCCGGAKSCGTAGKSCGGVKSVVPSVKRTCTVERGTYVDSRGTHNTVRETCVVEQTPCPGKVCTTGKSCTPGKVCTTGKCKAKEAKK